MSAARYLVIGAAGLVGSHLVSALRGRPVVTTYYRTGAPGGAPLDITNVNAVRAVVGAARPDVVLLAVAEPYVERCEREPETTRAVNVGGTRAVAAAAAECGATLVVFSSEYVFDGTRGDYTEDDVPAPLNEYGRQKVEVEEIARASGPHLICRTSGVFGFETARKNFVLQLVDALRAGREFTVPADQLITPSYAPSVADGVVELLDGSRRGTFHVGGPEIMSRIEFARRIARVFALDASLLRTPETREMGLAAARPFRAGLSDATLRAVLGHALTPVDAALRQMAGEVR